MRQCKNCNNILYLASLEEINGLKFLTCPACGNKQIFRKEKEEQLNGFRENKYFPLRGRKCHK